MPPSFLDTLSHSARQAYPIIQRGVREGLSSRSISEALSNAGLGLRRQTLLDVMRLESGIQSAGRNLQFISPNNRPDPSRLPSALTRLRRLYSFTVQVTGTLTATGQTAIQHITVTSDSLMTRAEIEQAAQDAAEEGVDKYGMEVDSVKLIGGKKASDLGVV
jgi:hypothetical protein